MRIVPGLNAVKAANDQVAINWERGIEQHFQKDFQFVGKEPLSIDALRWNAHDKDTRSIVSQFNSYLAMAPGYQSLDPLLIKAMLIVETGPTSKYWESSPMQSANNHDLGLTDLLSSQNTSKIELIVPPALRHNLLFPNSSSTDNIAAGVAYLLFESAHTGTKTEVTDSKIYTVTVQRDDDLFYIARHVGTTVAILEKMNNGITRFDLRPGMELKYQKTEKVTVIESWTPISVNSVYGLYNRNRRLAHTYTEELNFAYGLIRQHKSLQ